MNMMIRKWFLRLLSLTILSIMLVVVAVLNPGTLYANKTTIDSYTIYHQKPLDVHFNNRLKAAHSLISKSELYKKEYRTNICLNDGSFYPELMELVRGRAFGWGFLNTAVFRGNANFEENYIEIRNYKWNLEQLFAHEIAHTLQARTLGFWNTNPIADHPHWKWEGYAEYVSRKEEHQQSLKENIARLEASPVEWEVSFEDGTIAPRNYYEAWIMVQYCMEVKEMTYLELLESPVTKAEVMAELGEWKNLE